LNLMKSVGKVMRKKVWRLCSERDIQTALRRKN